MAGKCATKQNREMLLLTELMEHGMPKKHKHLTITSRQKKNAARLRDADKPKLSARIANQIKEFEAKGGKITQIGMGISGERR